MNDYEINNINHQIIVLTSDGEIFDSRQQKWKNGYKHNSGYYVIGKNITVANKKNYLPIKEHRIKSKNALNRKKVVPVGRRMLQIDLVTNDIIKIWESVTEVANYYNDIIQNFTPCDTNGQRKKNEFIWQYEVQSLLDNEIFKKLELFDEYYVEVSNKGRLKQRKSGKIWLGSKRPDNYHCVRYNDKGFRVHRLVAETFLKEELDKLIHDSKISKDKLEVDHIDGNNSNNCVENLKWVTRNEHMKKTGKQIKTDNH